MARRHYVGIDLGTCFSSLSYCDDDGQLETLRLPDGQIQIASAVYFKKDGSVVVGAEALEHAVVDASRVARAFKRQMGQPEYKRQVKKSEPGRQKGRRDEKAPVTIEEHDFVVDG